ncbi:hypothetical protein MVEN_00713500 [Mycena venus]|uniref:Uncharacterized protein n=1 Tax=Mycena venus TaxID=2733690 RepID=A0A8H6YIZ8_9AGAR|nr:hypothetical protein MVEN_00713500 [Mycena venus]
MPTAEIGHVGGKLASVFGQATSDIASFATEVAGGVTSVVGDLTSDVASLATAAASVVQTAAGSIESVINKANNINDSKTFSPNVDASTQNSTGEMDGGLTSFEPQKDCES